MPNNPRSHANSKTYHIIFKGVDNQNIFYEDKDRNIFLKQLSDTKKKYEYQIYAYCLMDNHIHLVIGIEDDVFSTAMQSLLIRYVRYFNRKYDRIGPLMQSRFKSKNIDNTLYFLRVCRYVHRNPQNSNISRLEDYKWSSYKEYIEKKIRVNKDILMSYFNDNIQELIKYTKEYSENEIEYFSEYEIITKLTDSQVADIITSKFRLNSNNEIPIFFKELLLEKRDIYISDMKNITGTNKTQIARIIHVGRKIIEKIWNDRL